MDSRDAWLVAVDKDWLVTFHDGTTEAQTGDLWVHLGVMYIQARDGRDQLYDLHMYPLTSVRKWEYVR
jgi:hypothetical protein